MDGQPEGTTDRGRRASPWVLAIALVLAVYLGFRLVEGVVWILGKL
jgi:hypothetical protein